MWSGSSVPGKSTVPSGNSGMSGTGSTVLSRDVITLVLHGELRQRTGGRKELAVRGAGRTAGAILEDLGIPGHETAALIVNAEQVEADRVLAEGDRLEVLPAISGGGGGGAPSGIPRIDLTRAPPGPHCTPMLPHPRAALVKGEQPGKGGEARARAPPPP